MDGRFKAGGGRRYLQFYIKEKRERVEKFKDNLDELLNVIDLSWMRGKNENEYIKLLEGSREYLGFDIPKILHFLRDLKRFKRS